MRFILSEAPPTLVYVSAVRISVVKTEAICPRLTRSRPLMTVCVGTHGQLAMTSLIGDPFRPELVISQTTASTNPAAEYSGQCHTRFDRCCGEQKLYKCRTSLWLRNPVSQADRIHSIPSTESNEIIHVLMLTQPPTFADCTTASVKHCTRQPFSRLG